jgi:predicted transposase YdaD
VLIKMQEESRAEGRKEGRKEGEATGLRAAVRDLCELLEVTLTPAQRAALEEMDTSALDALRARLKRDRRWD